MSLIRPKYYKSLQYNSIYSYNRGMKRYEQVPHTADFAAKVYGRDLAELFENAAFAMFDMMADLEGLGTGETIEIRVEAPDRESLLVAFLNELLYTAYIKQVIFTDFRVKNIQERELSAEARGGKIGADNRRLQSEIKAATYHDLKIEKTDSGYEITVVFDV